MENAVESRCIYFGKNKLLAGHDLMVLHRQVMELARILFEGICSKAVIQSQKEAFKGLEFQNQNAFNKPPKAPVAGKKPGGAIAFG